MDMIFRYRHDPGGMLYKGMPGGRSVTTFRNGDVVQCDYVVGFEKPIKRKVLAAQPEVARTVAEIIARNSDKLKGIPDYLDNGIQDGSCGNCSGWSVNLSKNCDFVRKSEENQDYYWRKE